MDNLQGIIQEEEILKVEYVEREFQGNSKKRLWLGLIYSRKDLSHHLKVVSPPECMTSILFKGIVCFLFI